MTRRATITSLAHYHPPRVVPNAFFEGRLDTSDEWIRSRTGIEERRFAEGGGTSDLIVPAALDCLAARGMEPRDVDCIVVATVTPDRLFPPTASTVAAKLGATGAWGFDVSAACSGFVYALVAAANLVQSGACRRVLLCGSDKMSSITNFEDRATAVLFGDAAGVVLLEATEDPLEGIIDHVCRMDGEGQPHLFMPAGGSLRPASAETVANREHILVQDGPVVFKAAVAGMAGIAAELMARNGLATDDVRWFVPHQANLRIIEGLVKEMDLDTSRVYVNIDRFGNTGAATIPIALDEALRSGRAADGAPILLVSFGAGATAGAAVLG